MDYLRLSSPFNRESLCFVVVSEIGVGYGKSGSGRAIELDSEVHLMKEYFLCGIL